MAMGSLSDSDDDFNPEINTTPLVDVMLVLLIIFIITIPVMNHAVKIDLPRATNQPDEPKPQNISLSIDASGKVFWNEEAIDSEQLTARIAEAAKKQPQPELHLRAERTTQYEKVAQVMAAAQSGGLSKIGFVTDPQAK
ncbi:MULTISPECIES: biopolymer transporter ExbD [unclassified Herbaspirillum]|jgi:biopolymer transport protein ExbD|uniref:ExbD/TolR family protein n=1 Tax=unclassified Herbaspirillum TaxID=2624150 RepID=UPI000E2EF5B0|nr:MULTISPECIES: biopolymer transporter ExbD [unclassified Herbaspirillum]RFB70654.1 biopolymer transporter ExbD [Herbaspirillum sp. 3R-3a1]TFI08825.1 biopolymer transporter ExbD [Herbaspirillum sp. 3R11]TFI15240.1 biopolymer transporter ExbD [Herbaspirillum sp. 3R-11]TFI19151.1 biopolymer transporter ExbD [Herbaspirillum sp. 3C11]